jgi:2-polyprenyl-3-methyl-5-hydroxy-6-metoxy-1,4-benzoquinol methylase
MTELTPRQQREVAYHARHSFALREIRQPDLHEVIDRPTRKWWNHYWVAYSILFTAGLRGRSVLVPGCGAGIDAIRCAKLGANVQAIDLSPDMLRLAEESAAAEGVAVEFRCMPAERLVYVDNTFDVIFVRDLLHHCDIGACLSELARVAKPGALVVIDELYTHSALQELRNSTLGLWVYAMVRPHIYHGQVPYITEDERKINEDELDTIRGALTDARCRYFNVIVNRFIPDWDPAEMVDRVLVKSIGPIGRWLAGRILLTGYVSK